MGDVARVKVFRKSRNAVGDFQFVQESKLESSELLRDITTNSDTELSYGRFDESNLSNYWITSSNISEKQKDVLSRVHAVIEKPSYILLVILYIEIYLLSFFTYVKSIFK